MGTGGSTSSGSSQSPSELFAFRVVKAEYERLKEVNQAIASAAASCAASDEVEEEGVALDDSAIHDKLQVVYECALREVDTPVLECKCPAVVIYKYSMQMNEEDRKQCVVKLLEVQGVRDKKLFKINQEKRKVQDYSQSFGGTADDSKNEKEAAALLRGTNNVEEDLDAVLWKPSTSSKAEQRALRSAGKWLKYLSAEGCFMYIHLLTRDVVSVRPEDYQEESSAHEPTNGDQESGGEPIDVANGLPRVPASDLPAQIEKIISEEKKTPLIIDRSAGQNARAYFSYKGLLEDVSCLTIPFGVSGVKREEIMERCRAKLVAAIKTGGTFALYLGEVNIEHADFKTKLCKKDVFPKDTFTHGGLKLLGPDYDPGYKKIFRDADKECGEAVAREGFKVVVISTLDPFQYKDMLKDCIPLGYMKAIYLEEPS